MHSVKEGQAGIPGSPPCAAWRCSEQPLPIEEMVEVARRPLLQNVCRRRS